jgi:hypothetical protein
MRTDARYACGIRGQCTVSSQALVLPLNNVLLPLNYPSIPLPPSALLFNPVPCLPAISSAVYRCALVHCSSPSANSPFAASSRRAAGTPCRPCVRSAPPHSSRTSPWTDDGSPPQTGGRLPNTLRSAVLGSAVYYTVLALASLIG